MIEEENDGFMSSNSFLPNVLAPMETSGKRFANEVEFVPGSKFLLPN